MTERNARYYHDDDALFRTALALTEAATEFSARLIEKDFFCSLLLTDLQAAGGAPLVFKGGTCLSKVYSEFYRLSEDLDFAVSAPTTAPRSTRSKLAQAAKGHLAGISRRIPALQVVDALRGYNNSTQYIARLGYRSVVTGQAESIQVELSMREPVCEPVEYLSARTLLTDPLRRMPAVATFTVACLSQRELYAEKLRAALSRRDPVIRDFFDLDHGQHSDRLDPGDQPLLALVRRKLALPGNEQVDLSAGRLATLRTQIASQLAPVLRPQDLAAFDLDRAWTIATRFAARLSAK
jgi:predicted nucleotidyltransferase component of viral defense system